MLIYMEVILNNINNNKPEEFILYTFKNINTLLDNLSKETEESKKVKSYIIKLLAKYKNKEIYGIDEFAKGIKDTYTLLIGNSDLMDKLFAIFLIIYFYDVKETKKKNNKIKVHIGIDYEFVAGEISLMQINFDTYGDQRQGYIWIVSPPKLSKKIMSVLIQTVMTNTRVYKILHGADSQDMPYIIDKMFEGDKNKAKLFVRKFIDTRFLCEYFKASVSSDKKCTIYDALLYFGTITKEKYDELDKLNKAMGPIQDVAWDISKMGSYDTRYAYFDVLYLKNYLYDIYKKINEDTSDKIQSYKYILQLVRFVILDRRGVIETVAQAKTDINPINNYMIKTKEKGNMTLISIYNDVIQNLKVKDGDDIIDFNFLLSLNYLKNSFTFILKKIVYFVARVSHTVWKNKNERMIEKIHIGHIFDDLKKLKYFRIIRLLNLFKSEVENLVSKYM